MTSYLLLFLCFSIVASAQRIEVREASEISMPGQVDSNSPGFWRDGLFHLLNSTGDGPVISRGADQFQLSGKRLSRIEILNPWPAWIEAVWTDSDGTIFAWYHQEHEYICGAQRPTMPQIGAAISYDGGRTFRDMGAILTSAFPADCSSKNGYFAGGHGDFSVVLDRERQYFYFLFGNYGGPAFSQGVVAARMAFDHRFQPAGLVSKYFHGAWNEPGIGGRMTPIFRAARSWQREDTDAYWGPSVHWNTHLGKWVMLMNRSCCGSGWPQEGIYASFSDDLSKPQAWMKPEKILDDTGWYPQVLGTGPNETDSLAGRKARLYIYGHSRWELVFYRGKPAEAAPAPAPVVPEP
jgi:hypothetical protein